VKRKADDLDDLDIPEEVSSYSPEYLDSILALLDDDAPVAVPAEPKPAG